MPARKKRKYTRREDKALASPPANKAILEPINKKSRQCDYCLTLCDDVYCPRCGRVTNWNKGELSPLPKGEVFDIE